MKILLVADLYYPPTLGGSAIAFRRLAHGLALQGHEVWVIAPGLKGFRHYVERDGQTVVIRCRSIPDLRIISAPGKTTVRVPLIPDGIIERTLDRLKPDVVHLQAPGYAGAIAVRLARKRNLPLVATCHSIPENYWSPKDKGSNVFKAVKDGLWDMILAMLDPCDLVCAPTVTACDLLHDNGLTRQAIPISNGIELDRYRPPSSDAEIRELRSRFGFPQDRPVVLYCGRFSPEKRVDILLAAIPSVLRRVRAHFAFVGTGTIDIAGEIESRGLSDAVTLTGLLSDQAMPLVYRAADVFVLPSEAELQGLVLLEAAASGLPLVGANALAIPEIVHHGVNGYLHVPGNAEDLADRLSDLLTDPELRHDMGLRSLELVAKHAIPESIKQYEEVYREAIARVATAGRS